MRLMRFWLKMCVVIALVTLACLLLDHAADQGDQALAARRHQEFLAASKCFFNDRTPEHEAAYRRALANNVAAQQRVIDDARP